jgi:YHS domain-containing protein
MISLLIREFLFPLLLFLFVRTILRSLFARFRNPVVRSAPGPTPPAAQVGGVLHKDPVCGTYVSSDSGIAATIDGKVTYFCSRECRDQYLGKRGAVSA